MVNKWRVYQEQWDQDGVDHRAWITQAPNGTETEHPTHTAAHNHIAAEQRKHTVLAALLLALLKAQRNDHPHPLP